MSKLFIYLKEYRKESILGPLFKLLEASFELIVPLVVAAIIDRGINAGDNGYIIRMSLVMVALGAVGLVSSLIAQYYAAKASAGFAKKLKHALFVHMQGFSYSELDTLGTSTLITRMTSDMNQVQTGLNLFLRLVLRSPFVVFGAMIMAFTVDIPMALIFAVAIPLLSLVVFLILLACLPLYKKVQARLDRVLGLTRENLTGARVIRAFGKEESEIAEFERRNSELTGMQKHVGRISALMNPVTYVLINAAVICLIRLGGIRVDIGILTQGQVVALYNYMTQILVELIKLATLIVTVAKAVSCAGRVQAIFEIPSGEKAGESAETGSPEYIVEFRHAGLTYKNAGETALTDVDFKVSPGQVIGIIGGTGSGKSSLVNLIPRFYDATEGAVLVGGKDVKSYEPEKLRLKIGVVPQKAVLFHGTIRENLKWGNPDATDSEMMEALEAAQGKEVVLSKKDGLDAVIEQGGKNLSGGQRQRLTIARALVRQPEILILDDSSSALDFATDAALRQSLSRLSYKPAVFLVSQRTSSIRHADQIIVLEDGKIAGLGTHEKLLETCEVYREIYNSQFKKGGIAQ